MPLVILTYLIQLALIVHVFKTGRNTYWVYLLLMIPGLGGMAYLIVELIPGWLNTRTGSPFQKNIKNTIDPDKELRIALRNVEITDTAHNISKLAEQYLLRGRYKAAIECYDKCLVGLNKNDPAMMEGLATAYFGLNDPSRACSLLEALIEENPGYKSPEGHLLYARALEKSGQIEAAIHEYAALIRYYPGPEPTCRLAQLFKDQGQADQAQELFNKIVTYSKHAGKHYNAVNKNWVVLAKRELNN